MCELLAINFERPVFVDFTIRAFSLRDVENADGWGLAWYPDRSLAVAKEPVTWTESEYADFLQTYSHLRAAIYIGHVRKKTVGGEPTHADCQPFSRELNGREYCFAHNGTIYGADELPRERFMPLGTTDSERVMCHILELIVRRGSDLDDTEAWRWLHTHFMQINSNGKFNCALSDSHTLVCYHDMNGFKGMWVRQITTHQHEWQHYDDQTLHVDVEAEGENRGVVMASRPLSEAAWRQLLPGQMIVVRHGDIVYSSGPTIAMTEPEQRERTQH